MKNGTEPIEAILWDVDGTLLDFHASEREAIRALFAEFGLGECTPEMIARYSAINDIYWKRLEKNEITKEEVLVGRFQQFFREEGLDASVAPAFNEKYQLALGDTIVYRDDSLALVQSLRGVVKQYAVSNGTVVAQTKKLAASGIGPLMDGIFLSEEVGAEKPNLAFFEKVFAEVYPIAPARMIIVGDSLTSDIRGGNVAGIRTCWYNPEGKDLPAGYHVDHVISDLREVRKLLWPEQE